MKTLKIKHLLSALAAFCFAVGVIQYAGATSQPEVVKKEKSVEAVKVVTTDDWYFTGSSTSGATTAASYSPDEVSGKPCGTSPQTICRIDAPEDQDNPGFPDMDYLDDDGISVAQHITNALSSLPGNPQENDVVKAFRSF